MARWKPKIRRLHKKSNPLNQIFLAILVVLFAVVVVIVVANIEPVSPIWKDNVLLRMIIETHKFITGQ